MNVHTMKAHLILLAVLGLFCSNQFAHAQSTSIKECSGRLIICLTESDSLYELCVKVTPGTCQFKSYKIDWGDNKVESFNTNFTSEIEKRHIYDLRTFVKNCESDKKVFVSVETDCVDGDNGSFFVTFKNSPRVNFSINNACEGQKPVIRQESCPNASDITYLWNYGNGQTSTGFQPNFSFPVGATDYSIKLSASRPGCTPNERTVSGKIQKKPVANYSTQGLTIQNQDTVVCLNNGGLLTMDGTISIDESRYRWTITGGKYSFQDRTNSGSGIVKIKFEETATYTVTLVVENDCGTSAPMVCKHRVVDTLTVQLPKLDFICQQPYRYRIPTPVAGAVYTLNGQALADPATGVDLQYSSTPYIVEVRLQGPCGLQIERDTFTVNAPQKVDILAKDTTVCVGSRSFTLRANLSGGTWSGSNVNAQTGVFTPPQSVGTFSIIYSRGTGLCGSSDTIQITVQGVQAKASDVSSCQGASVVRLIGTPVEGKWTTSDCSNCIQGDSLLLAGVTLTRLTVNYEVVSSAGCRASAQATVTIGRPKADFTIKNACKDSLVTITNPSQGAADFQWFVNGKRESTERLPSFRNFPAGEVTVQLFASSGTCRDSVTKSVTITAPPEPVSFTIERQSDCAPLRATFRVSPTQRSDVQYSWDFQNGTFSGYQPPARTFENTARSPRTYSTQLIAQNTCGRQTASQTVTVRPVVTSEIGVDSTLVRCTPAKIKFSNRSTGFDPARTLWLFDDGTAPFRSRSDTLSWEFSTRDSVRTFRVRLVVMGECGTDTSEVFIKVYPTIVKPLITLPSPACPGELVQFKDATTPKPDRWLWKFGNEGTSTLANPTVALQKANTTYTITLIAYTFCGYDSTQRTFRTTELPRADFSIGAPFSCAGSAIPLANLSPQNNAFLWSFGDGSLDSTSRNPAHSFQAEGLKTISLTVYGSTKLCKNEAKKSVTIRPKVKAAFSVEGTSRVCSPALVVLRNTSQNATRYEWRLSNGLTSKAEQPSFALGPGRYDVTLKATYEGACLDSTQQIGSIQVDSCSVSVPQVFTPNGDLSGDFYTVFGSGIERIANIRIRNRAGIIVFEAADIPAGQQNSAEAWDGTYQGRPMPADMYALEVTISYIGGRRESHVGNIYLIR